MREGIGRYIVRRLGFACLSLLGISVVTFALVHLAPGDAASGGQGSALVSREAAEAQRRLFFLDLPLFFNADPLGVLGRADRLCGRVAVHGIAGLLRCGTACAPSVAKGLRRCRSLPQHLQSSYLKHLRAAHPALPSLDESGGKKALLDRLDAARIDRIAAKLGGEDRAESDLVGLGSAAVPAVIRVLLKGQAPSADAAARVARRLVGVGGALAPGAVARRAGLKRWEEWWYQHQRDYLRFSAGARRMGHLTETRFAKWVGRIASLDFGYSLSDGRPVSEKLAEALPITLLLSLLSLLLAYVLAVPLAVHGAARKGRGDERAISLLLFALYSTPSFWMAMMLVMLLGGVGYADVFPIHGLSSPGAEELTALNWLLDRLWHLVLPVFCLSYGSLAVLSRYQRGALLDALGQDYIRTARSKGLSERRVIWRHALPNALLPMITLLGLQFPYLIGGSVIIERIFGIPGMGLLAFEAFLQRDYPLIMAVSVLSAALTLFGLLVADILYAFVDPRICLDAGKGPPS
ncbi:MAG: ABC transporter permease [Deltaproteobacteria bacterium]|nr:ABC transporter permease [Deltaproteobacteria bacterium]